MTGLRAGEICAGYGGLALAIHEVLGGELAYVADNDAGASAILAHRFPGVPNLGDITTADWGAVEPASVFGGGFPCQPASHAGPRKGLNDERWLFDDICAAISRMDPRPGLLVFENVPGLLTVDSGDAMARVVQGLAVLGYVGRYRLLRASDVGACHRRERIFLVAWPAAQDPHRAASRQWRPAASGEAEGWRSRADAGRRGGVPVPALASLTLLPTPAARDWKSGASNLMDRNSRPLNEFAVNMLGHIRTPDAPWVATDGTDYGPAIRHWETVTGRPAPCPTEPGERRNRRLSARFAEWMMGLPAGWVTEVPGLGRDEQIRAIGNGVVPQQAVAALRLLLPAYLAEAGEAA